MRLEMVRDSCIMSSDFSYHDAKDGAAVLTRPLSIRIGVADCGLSRPMEDTLLDIFRTVTDKFRVVMVKLDNRHSSLRWALYRQPKAPSLPLGTSIKFIQVGARYLVSRKWVLNMCRATAHRDTAQRSISSSSLHVKRVETGVHPGTGRESRSRD